MKRLIRVYFALFVLLMSSTGVWAQGITDYAIILANMDGANAKTLMFKSEKHTVSGSNEWEVPKTTGDVPWESQTGDITQVVFDPSFADAHPTSCYRWFAACENLTSITGIENLNTSEVTNMYGMFNGCSSLTSLDLSSFNTSKVTDMNGMFSGCSSLAYLSIGGGFTVSGSTNTNDIFTNCGALANGTLILTGAPTIDDSQTTFFSAFTNGTLIADNNTQSALNGYGAGNWNGGTFSSVESGIAYAVLSDGTLTFQYGVFTPDNITSWDVSNTGEAKPGWNSQKGSIKNVVFTTSFAAARPISCANWFEECKNLTSITGIENLNTSDVTNMFCMFKNCNNLQSLDVSHFDTGNVTSMFQMFLGCSSLKSLDVSHFNTNKVTKMYGMFNGCSDLKSLDLSSFNTSNVENMGWMFNGCSGLTSLDLSNFNTSKVTDMHEMFDGCKNLKSLDLSNFNTSNVTTMSWMFQSCSSLKSLDVSHFNTEKVTTMQNMFQDCRNLKDLDVSHFNTSKVGNMEHMFADCRALTGLNVSGFNTSNVTNMNMMFYGCWELLGLDVSNFNTSQVTDMGQMFQSCSKLESLDLSSFNTGNVKKMYGMFYDCSKLGCLSISGGFTIHETSENGNTAGKTYTVDMFKNCTALTNGTLIVTGTTAPTIHASQTTLFNVFTNGTLIANDLTQANLGVDGPTDGLYAWHGGKFSSFGAGRAYASLSDGILMFKYGVHPVLGDNEWDVSNTTSQPWYSQRRNIMLVEFDPSFAGAHPKNCANWFNECTSLDNIDGIVNLNTSEVENMSNMFSQCRSLQSLDVSHFNTSKVTDMSGMFYDCSVLTSLDVSHFNTEKVEDMNSMFSQCSSLTSLDLSHFNTSKVKDMNGMFYCCYGLTSLDLSSFNTSNVTNMFHMFCGCSGLTSLDLSSFDTGNVTSMQSMFSGCTKLTSLDLSNFNTDNVKLMLEMFRGCSSLLRIEVGSFNTSKVTRMEDMFCGCDNLTYLDLSNFNTSLVTNMKQMFSGCEKLKRLSIGKDFTIHETSEDGYTAGKTYTVDMFKDCSALAEGQLIVMVNNANSSNAPSIAQDIFGVFTNGKLITNFTKDALGVVGDGPYTWHGGTFQHVGGDEVDYLDEHGVKQTATNALPITAGCSELPAGWYYVGDDVFMNHTLTFTGDAHLILCDDATLTINVTGTDKGINLDTHYLIIYAQSSGDHAGSLTINSDSEGIYGNPSSGGVTINGGTITANAKGEIGIFCYEFTLNGGALTVNASGSDAYGIFAYDKFTIKGGKLSAIGTDKGIFSAAVTINGGQVTASGATYGISSSNDLTLGWTNASDYIKASSYYLGTVKTASDKSFNIEGGGTLAADITLDDDQRAAIANKTLIPASSFAGGTGVTKYTTLISNNGDWNITDPNTKVYVPTGRIVKDGDVYKMELLEVTGGIPSGVPVILYNANDLPANVSVVGAQGNEIDDIENNYQAATPSPAFFVSDGTKKLDELIQGALGVVDPNDYIAFTLVNDKLVMASNSGYPVAAGKFIFVLSKLDVLKMMRGTYNPPTTSAPALGIPFGLGDEPTEIKNVNSEQADSWWTIDGRKLNNAPAAKGVYINNGKKIIIK